MWGFGLGSAVTVSSTLYLNFTDHKGSEMNWSAEQLWTHLGEHFFVVLDVETIVFALLLENFKIIHGEYFNNLQQYTYYTSI